MNARLSRAGQGGHVKLNFMIFGVVVLAATGAVYAQNAPTKKKVQNGSTKGTSAAAARGKEVFDKKCGVCHYADSDAKKIGPWLKGLSTPRTFSLNNTKLTDETFNA